MAKNETYEEFVEKFKPKLTTDDCFTPTEVYEAVKNWAVQKYKINPDKIVRPFWPGGDYTSYEYQEGCIVLDNPPFSILAKIIRFYLDRNILFFLFAPGLTAFSGQRTMMECCHIICGAKITYENGAIVNTAFATNLEKDIIAMSEPELKREIEAAQKKIKAEKTKQMPKYKYPDHIITAAMFQYLSNHGVYFSVSKKDCIPIAGMDAQKEYNKAIFGGGLLLSNQKAAEKAAAEKAAAIVWELSEREREIIKSMEG